MPYYVINSKKTLYASELVYASDEDRAEELYGRGIIVDSHTRDSEITELYDISDDEAMELLEEGF